MAMTNAFICNRCETQFFSAAVEFVKDCPNCKAPEVVRLVPERVSIKWVCSHCKAEKLHNVNLAGTTCIYCKKGRWGLSPSSDEMDSFMQELDKEMSAFEHAMGLELGDLQNCSECGHYPCDECAKANLIADDSSLKLEPILEECVSCSNDCDGCEHEEKLSNYMVGKKPKALKGYQKDVLKKIDPIKYPPLTNRPKVNRGPREYCRWCTHWTRKAECYGYCRKHDVVRNAFLHCIDFFRNQWAKDKIVRWPT